MPGARWKSLGTDSQEGLVSVTLRHERRAARQSGGGSGGCLRVLPPSCEEPMAPLWLHGICSRPGARRGLPGRTPWARRCVQGQVVVGRVPVSSPSKAVGLTGPPALHSLYWMGSVGQTTPARSPTPGRPGGVSRLPRWGGGGARSGPLAWGLRHSTGGSVNASSLVGPLIRPPRKPEARRGDGAGLGICTPQKARAGLL